MGRLCVAAWCSPCIGVDTGSCATKWPGAAESVCEWLHRHSGLAWGEWVGMCECCVPDPAGHLNAAVVYPFLCEGLACLPLAVGQS